MVENHLAWHIYNIAGSRDRQVAMGFAGLISSIAILHLCEEYDATHEDFEKVMTIDAHLYEIRHKQNEEERKLKEATKELNQMTKTQLHTPKRKK